MSDRGIILSALIVGGAIVAASFYGHSRFTLSAAGQSIAWRMDTWSGQVDLCAATYLPNGPPLVRCGALAIVPQPGGTPSPPPTTEPAPVAPSSPLDAPNRQSL